MDSYTLIVLILIGLAAGALGGMFGVGGGLIIVPALILLLSLSPKAAQGTSVAVMLPPIGILAAINYYKAGYLNMKYALIIALAFIIGGYFGSKLAIAMPEGIAKKIFAGFMILTAVKMFFDK
jgi:uncharacterized membrane protein YfcA